jgi:dTDP-glucose 4,6-dehydratase
MGHPADAYDAVPDRPAHDLRYTTDSTKLRAELDWNPTHENFESALTETITWYQSNVNWWQPLKASTEARYTRLGR